MKILDRRNSNPGPVDIWSNTELSEISITNHELIEETLVTVLPVPDWVSRTFRVDCLSDTGRIEPGVCAVQETCEASVPIQQPLAEGSSRVYSTKSGNILTLNHGCFFRRSLISICSSGFPKFVYILMENGEYLFTR